MRRGGDWHRERSPWKRAFCFVENVLKLPAFPLFPLLRRNSEIDGLDYKALGFLRHRGLSQARAEYPIDGLLHGLFRSVIFFFEEVGYIFVDSQSGSHIMMLAMKTS